MRLLLVEDDSAVLESIKDILTLTFDIEVLSTLSPKEALKIVRNEKIDILLCDIKMPELSGLELVSILRSEGFNIPIVMCSAYADKDNALMALRLHVFDFIEKPFKKDDLFIVVKRGKDVIYKPGEKLPIKLVKPATFTANVVTPETPDVTGNSTDTSMTLPTP